MTNKQIETYGVLHYRARYPKMHAREHDQRRGLLLRHLFFFGDPCFYGFFDSSG
jgi:hypothetical protein